MKVYYNFTKKHSEINDMWPPITPLHVGLAVGSDWLHFLSF